MKGGGIKCFSGTLYRSLPFLHALTVYHAEKGGSGTLEPDIPGFAACGSTIDEKWFQIAENRESYEKKRVGVSYVRYSSKLQTINSQTMCRKTLGNVCGFAEKGFRLVSVSVSVILPAYVQKATFNYFGVSFLHCCC